MIGPEYRICIVKIIEVLNLKSMSADLQIYYYPLHRALFERNLVYEYHVLLYEL
jgi:hypothetical protein